MKFSEQQKKYKNILRDKIAENFLKLNEELTLYIPKTHYIFKNIKNFCYIASYGS